MPEINHQNFEHKALEADIERLSREIKEKRNLPEYKELSDKELIKKSLESITNLTPSTSQPAVKNQSSTTSSQILPNYLKDVPAETKLQVEELVDSLFHQGIEKVIARARRASPFILDAFHDALVDKLYEELKKRKLI
jgi:hypothetical protein